jgi:hypothetical protein
MIGINPCPSFRHRVDPEPISFGTGNEIARHDFFATPSASLRMAR